MILVKNYQYCLEKLHENINNGSFLFSVGDTTQVIYH